MRSIEYVTFLKALRITTKKTARPWASYAGRKDGYMMTYITPTGYNEYDYKKLVAFLEQPDDEGVKNGVKNGFTLSKNYDPNDPATWGTNYWGNERFQWRKMNGELRIQAICVSYESLCGTLDLSGCTALERLECDRNNLTELNVSGCTSLTRLDCRNNSLAKLDVSGCAALEDLSDSCNNLTELNVSGCAALEDFDNKPLEMKLLDGYNPHDYQKLVALGFTWSGTRSTKWMGSKQTRGSLEAEWVLIEGELRLQRFKGHGDDIVGEIDLSGCTALEQVDLTWTELTALDLSGCTSLREVSFAETGVHLARFMKPTKPSVNVRGCTALESLYCYSNKMVELDVSSNPALKKLSCGDNNLTTLDVSSNPALERLYCNRNNLTTLDVSSNPALEYLNCGYNQLTELNVSNNTALKELDCYDNNLAELNVSGCTALEELWCYNNPMTTLNVRGLANLKALYTNERMEEVDIRDTSLDWDVLRTLKRSVKRLVR